MQKKGRTAKPIKIGVIYVGTNAVVSKYDHYSALIVKKDVSGFIFYLDCLIAYIVFKSVLPTYSYSLFQAKCVILLFL